MESIIEQELLNSNFILEKTEHLLKNKKIIGLYFSGHYCPPCKKFTPLLAEVYEEIKENNLNDLEIIFVSSDKEQDSFIKYYKEMPWLALPYERRDIKNKLCEQFNVKTIPTLIFFDNNGKLLEREGRRFIEKNTNNIDNIISLLLNN
jgi:nucleoredoxin